ncbi:peptidoglycan-binding protein LysM [Streptomyces spinoverrucosus]|uniref:Peptidoglycan-binding protein LysM n=1 Tax=Streptomyces spinoverrucosus TaxID=284043 RepID=A0A4Y3VL01_9ACTN|nr:transglycosylase family protein [Streptomyces spinoverrucosus]GEC06818.1 peptidoglycan-binding protein LysM [Streptomyces spinoverrucosus]GHB80158.1 peptidoglycan-binding protein LysM [Streptomyces spinoverrucosus]
MLSGNGRHRRPRQAPALVVAAGVTGSAIAIPLLGATGASAASGTTWDRVAECETGGSWSADTGNGYYGGLQLSQDDWEKYGGLTYAASADRASRSQQIAVAEKVLADQGVGAWATCGPLVGLDTDSASARVDTGVAGDASSTPLDTRSGDSGSLSNSLGLSNSSSGSYSGGTASSDGSSAANGSNGSNSSNGVDSSNEPSGSDTPTNSANPTESTESSESTPSSGSTSSTPSTPSGTSTPSSGSESSQSPESGESVLNSPSPDVSSSTPSTSNLTDTGALLGLGKHRGDSANEEAADGRTVESSGRHASRSGATTRAAADGSYTVREGDSLAGIADSLGVQGGWSTLYAENKDSLGTDPNLILPGQTLDVGVESGS